MTKLQKTKKYVPISMDEHTTNYEWKKITKFHLNSMNFKWFPSPMGDRTKDPISYYCELWIMNKINLMWISLEAKLKYCLLVRCCRCSCHYPRCGLSFMLAKMSTSSESRWCKRCEGMRTTIWRIKGTTTKSSKERKKKTHRSKVKKRWSCYTVCRGIIYSGTRV